MDIIRGTILTQPILRGEELRFDIQSNQGIFTVIRRQRQAQKKDILFLCVGQEIVLCASPEGECMAAEKIRITDYSKRTYILMTNENEEVTYGDSTC